MMNFRKIKENLICKVLGPSANGRFQVFGFQRQVSNAEEILDLDREVQVYYSSGEFPKRGSRNTGSVAHNCTFSIVLLVAKAVVCDVSVLDDPNATDEDRALALAEGEQATVLVDESFDELCDIIFQILMDANNYDMGFAPGVVSDRWISRQQKDDIGTDGEYVVLSGSIEFTIQTREEIEGEEGSGTATEYSVTVDQDGDDVEKAGVSGTLGAI